MGVALPSVVNLYYVTPEVFVREVRACGYDQRRLLNPWREAGPCDVGVPSFPPSLLVQTVGPQGQPGLGVPPAPTKTTP